MQLKFNINSLPPGWVKETAFTKCSDGIRKDKVMFDRWTIDHIQLENRKLVLVFLSHRLIL